MSRRSKRRRAEQQRAARPGRPSGGGPSAADVSPSALAAIGLMAAVAVVAAAIIGMGLYWVANDPVAESVVSGAEEPADSDGQDGGATSGCGGEPVSGPAQVEVSTRPVGPLTSEITARVTVNAQPLTDASPAVIADMVEMPCAHTSPAASLQAVPGQPGVYQGRVQVVMVGTWKFVVQLNGGVAGGGSATTPVTTFEPGS